MTRLRLALALAASSAASGGALAKEAAMDEAVFANQERVYVGRFSVEVPAGAKRYGMSSRCGTCR